MSMSVFLKPKESYIRHLDPVNDYIEQMANFLSISTNESFEKCKAFIVNGLRDKQFENVRNPIVSYFERQANGDRFKTQAPLTDYIKTTVQNGDIIAPSFTTYLHPSVKPSLITAFTDENTKRRSIAKKQMFKAKAEKNMLLFTFKNNEQNNKKLSNNSLSGAFVAKGSFVNNPSAHSTLTSTTRTGTSLANASNEKLIAGSRHYWSPDIVMANLISICTLANLNEIDQAIRRFNLVYPSVEDVVSCITRSSDLYWIDHRALGRIRTFIERMSPVQRAAFMYCGDLYHIRKMNDAFVRHFIRCLSRKATGEAVDPLSLVHGIDEQIMILAHHICSHEVKGMGKDYEKMHEHGKLGILVATAQQIVATVEEFQPFIQAFFTTSIIPSSVAYIRDMVRRVVVISDTDSTCFTTGEWVEWARGEMVFDDESLAIAGAITYFATQTFLHTMALYSANINVEKAKLHTLAYKSEWTWSVVTPMNVAKHYFARALIQEGNVFEEPELELKGVHLKNSNTPQRIVKDSISKIESIMDTVTSNKKISIIEYLNSVADMEALITESLLRGDLEFYRQVKIKEAEAYSKDVEESPFQHHLLWGEVFEPKYGAIEAPPYAVVKVPTTLNNPTAIKQWLDTIEDRAFAERMGMSFSRNKKTSFNTFYISSNYLKSFGMPIEIRPIIDIKRILLDLCNIYYIVLESLGFYKKEGMTLTELGYGTNNQATRIPSHYKAV